MAHGNNCYLCGGKLKKGVCIECGLDNVRMTRRNYRLNVTTPAHIKQKQVAAQRAEDMKYARAYKAEQMSLENLGREQNRGNANRTAASSVERRSAMPQRTNQRQKTVKGGSGNKWKGLKVVGIVYALLAVIPAIGGCVESLIDDFSYMTPEHMSVASEAEAIEIPAVSDDDYAFVERELSETGDYFEEEFGPGYYKVGVHIPEGRYTAQLSQGEYGNIWLNDDKNGIYMSPSFGEESSDGYKEMEDLRLYEGAYLEINGDVRLTFISENAQTDALTGMENPMEEAATATFVAEGSAELIVGEDIPAGFYDISAVDGWSSVRTVYISDEEYSYEYYYWIDSETLEDSYRNVLLVDGMTISMEDCEVQFTPSVWIPTDDYDAYWAEYFV